MYEIIFAFLYYGNLCYQELTCPVSQKEKPILLVLIFCYVHIELSVCYFSLSISKPYKEMCRVKTDGVLHVNKAINHRLACTFPYCIYLHIFINWL